MPPNLNYPAAFRARCPRFVVATRLCAILFSAVLLFLPSDASAARQGEVNHVVVFWLKHPERAADRAALARASEKFRELPGVLRVDVGNALPVRRKVEQRFDMCVVFTFRNRAALARFEADPKHTAAIASVLRPLVKRYVVFNSIVDG